MVCKKVGLEDIVKVCELYLQEENLEYNDRKKEKYIKRSKRIYKKMLKRGSYTLACYSENGNILGVVNVNKILDYYPKYEKEPYIHLETLIVKKTEQNKGIATYLLKSAKEILDKEGYTYIIAQSNNIYVQKILKKVGLTDSSVDMRIDIVK